MKILNFSHPLTPEQLRRVEELAQQPLEDVLHVETDLDPQSPIVPQVRELLNRIPLSTTEWQTTPLVVNPPALNVIATVLVTELSGRMGYLPAITRLRAVEGSPLRVFEVAEIINLQSIRDEARRRR